MIDTASQVAIISEGDLAVNMASFGRHLRAENLSPRTQETYTEAVRQFARFVAAQGMPQEVANIRREHVEAFIADLLERWKPATASNRTSRRPGPRATSIAPWLLPKGSLRCARSEKNPMIPGRSW